MRKKEEILEAGKECYDSLVEDREYYKKSDYRSDIKTMVLEWIDYYCAFYDGLNDGMMSDVDAEHYTAACISVAQQRYENTDWDSMVFENFVRKALVEYEIFYIWFTIFNMRNRKCMKEFSRFVKYVYNKTNDKSSINWPDFSSIYDTEGAEYDYVESIQCSLKGVDLLERHLGPLPEFDSVRDMTHGRTFGRVVLI